ncbi:MAG: hypothetical protein HY321_03935 [Armatimonadetes bacterium]|nr:hypothetical protein [Armatimonadota bacterium]
MRSPVSLLGLVLAGDSEGRAVPAPQLPEFSGEKTRSSAQAISMACLERQFADPPREHGPLPWWMWNGDMDYGEIERQLQEFARSGVRGFLHRSPSRRREPT